MKFSAVVVTAGRGQRFHAERTKQLVRWDGKPLIAHTLQALSILSLHQIALVVRPEEEAEIREWVSPLACVSKIVFVSGGERRQDSVRAGLEALEHCDRVMIHDGARPFLKEDFLMRLWRLSHEFQAVIPAIPVIETLKEINHEGFVVKTHRRESFVRVQTPQVFSFERILAIHRDLAGSDREFTDDAAMVEFVGEPVKVCSGDLENIKVTIQEDLKRVGVCLNA